VVLPNPLPQITAQSYAIFDMKTNALILGRKENLKREVASLTKIMTFYTILDLMTRYKIDPDSHIVTVSKWAVYQSGTTASLCLGDEFTVIQLLYAMMLPSGNDAAFALAEHFGEMVYNEKFNELDSTLNSYNTGGGSSPF
jgi:D-alanyl-D-alanine carboxypeptidase